MTTTLIVGFDSAWTRGKRGGIAAVRVGSDRLPTTRAVPSAASFEEAQQLIGEWRTGCDSVLVMLDQPTVVPNAIGRRPVEHIVSSMVGTARGGVQPANRGRLPMFGPEAPLWAFLATLGAGLDPRPPGACRVIETYPALALLGWGWERADGELPKYNPTRKTYRHDDWRSVCGRLRAAFAADGLLDLAAWCEEHERCAGAARPRKEDQDGIDALLCLRVGLDWRLGRRTLMIGTPHHGLMVVPDRTDLAPRLRPRLERLELAESEWLTDLTGFVNARRDIDARATA